MPLCCESSRKCHHAAQTTPTLTNNNYDMFYKIDCCAANHGRKLIYHVPFSYIFFFDFEKCGVKPGVPIVKNSLYTDTTTSQFIFPQHDRCLVSIAGISPQVLNQLEARLATVYYYNKMFA